MTITEQTKKLLEYSVVLKAEERKTWTELLPTMSEPQVQTLYGVLVDEVKAWKKEGISIIPDLSVEMQLLPNSGDHGASLNSLKARLEGKPADAPKPAPVDSKFKVSGTDEFAKELSREVNTPEIAAPTAAQAKPEEKTEPEPVFGEIKPDMPNMEKNAWMLSSKVVVPKMQLGVIAPQPMGVPKVRNRVASSGLTELRNIRTVDDLSKIEAAHLRQGPLNEQILFIKQRLGQLAKENDMLPVNILPIFEQSPLFQVYLKVGSLMIEKNIGDDKVSFEQIMVEIESTGQDSITLQEFEAIADLKKELEALAGM